MEKRCWIVLLNYHNPYLSFKSSKSLCQKDGSNRFFSSGPGLP